MLESWNFMPADNAKIKQKTIDRHAQEEKEEEDEKKKRRKKKRTVHIVFFLEPLSVRVWEGMAHFEGGSSSLN